MKVSLACSWCKKLLSRFPSQIKGRKYGAFCDLACLGAFRSDRLTGTLAANFSKGVARDRKYIMALVPWHPNADESGHVYLHRLVSEARIGRFLESHEIVHHIDENPENNHWDNLEITSQSAHAKEHMASRLKDPKSGRLK